MNIEIHAEVVDETDKLYFVNDWDGKTRRLPKIEVSAKLKCGELGNYYAFRIPESFAIKKGFI